MAYTKNNTHPYTLVKNCTEKKLRLEAKKLFKSLIKKKMKIVFVESCTAGKAASIFCEIPNSSKIFCGSFVVYRENSKKQWLKIDSKKLKKYTHVSKETSLALAKKALQQTKEAHLSIAITGHFGPKCLKSLEGIYHIALQFKKGHKNFSLTQSYKIINNAHKKFLSYEKIRSQRQMTASHSLFLMVRSLLS